jgi:hypothetical protein
LVHGDYYFSICVFLHLGGEKYKQKTQSPWGWLNLNLKMLMVGRKHRKYYDNFLKPSDDWSCNDVSWQFSLESMETTDVICPHHKFSGSDVRFKVGLKVQEI